ncbi:MAG: hypothetical protein IPP38_11695 [Bacteroidetes bacterium]|nr:hypothetical protein [Bacteroidota bacterium]
MKKFYTLSFLFLCSALHTFGTVRTVSNHSALGSQYSTLLAAYTAAADGDTLLLEGTDIPYEYGSGSQYWTKNLTVIGIGINSQKDNYKKSIIHGTWSGTFKISGLGSRFYGIVFETVIDGRNSSNLSFYNCLFKQPVVFQSPGPNCSFVNSVFESTDDDIQVVSDAQSPISLISCIVNGSIVDYNLYPEDHPWSIESFLFYFLAGVFLLYWLILLLRIQYS